VYELSARVAIYAQDQNALSSILGRLVPDLYDAHEEHVLSASLSKLSTTAQVAPRASTKSSPPSGRDEYTALYLIHLLLAAYPSQRYFLKRSHDLLRPSSPHYHLVRDVGTYARRNDFWRLCVLVLDASPERSNLIQAMLVLLLNRIRGRIWAVLKAAYMQLVSDSWLCRVLGFASAEALKAFMEDRMKRGEVSLTDGKYVVVRTAKSKT